MAAAARSSKYTTIGTGANPESNVLVESTNIDVSSNLEFATLVASEVEVRINVASASTGAPSIVFTVQGWNPASGLWDDLVTSAAVAAAGNTKLLIGPNVVPVGNIASAVCVRERLRLRIAYTGTPVTDVLNGVTVAVFAS